MTGIRIKERSANRARPRQRAPREAETPIKVPDPPENEVPRTEPETPKVGSRDAPGG